MGTRFSRRLRLVIAAAIILFAAIIGWLIFSSPSSHALTISSVRMESGQPRTAVVGLTNCSRHRIFLGSVNFQTLQNGLWSNGVDRLRVEYVDGDARFRPGGFGHFFAPNDYKAIKINGVPETGSWRISIQYSEERSALSAFPFKTSPRNCPASPEFTVYDLRVPESHQL